MPRPLWVFVLLVVCISITLLFALIGCVVVVVLVSQLWSERRRKKLERHP